MYLAKRMAVTVFIILLLSISLKIDAALAEYQVNPYWFRIIGGRPNNDIVVLKRVQEKRNSFYRSKLSIPVIHGTSDKELYEQLNDMFSQGIIHFDHEIEVNANRRLRDLALPPEQSPYYITEVDFKVNYNAGGLLSITVFFSHYTDKFNEMSFMETVNVDLTTGRAIEFYDLFATEQERNALIKMLNDEIRLNPTAYYIDEIAPSYLEQIQSFYLMENHIVIYFDSNYLCPCSMGIPEFPFELSKAVRELRRADELAYQE